MYLKIISNNENGERAMNQLMEDSSYGLAIRTVVNKNPYTIHIKPKGIQRYNKLFSMMPGVVETLKNPMIQALKEYGAKDEDYFIEVVF